MADRLRAEGANCRGRGEDRSAGQESGELSADLSAVSTDVDITVVAGRTHQYAAERAMKHYQPTSTDRVLHLAYLPGGGSSFVLPLVTRLNAARTPRLKAVRRAWPDSELSGYGLAVSTKLAMLSLIAGRIYPLLSALYAEFTDHAKVEEHVTSGSGWLTANRRLPYELLLVVDCFLFEFRSCYEILGAFLHKFFEVVLDRQVTEDEILGVLSEAGIETSWVEDLQRHRILFFHKTAPWLAVSIDTPELGDRELLILHSPDSDPTDPKRALTFSRLRAIYAGLEAALHKIQEWALSEMNRVDTDSTTT